MKNPTSYESIDPEDQRPGVSQNDTSHSIQNIAIFCAAVALLGTFAVFASPKQMLSDIRVTNFDTTSASSSSYSLKRVNYDSLSYFGSGSDSIFQYEFLSGYDAVIEPNVPMELELNGDDDDSSVRYGFSVCNREQDCWKGGYSTTSSDSVTIDCTPGQVMELSVKKYVNGEEVGDSYTGFVICMYVRREIRDLTEDDLSDLMDAMYVLWNVSETDGQARYGDNYHDASYMLNFHHFNAAWQESDHIHEGNGFLAQHLKLTNVFETAIQAVNPAVSLPYWDFTIDVANNQGVFESEVFSPSMFGSAPVPKNIEMGFQSTDLIVDAAIPDGRWAYIKAEMNTKYADLKAGYGYMRAPWNMNPSPYVTRFAADYKIGITFPTCSQHYEILESDSLVDFLYNVENGPHGTAHSLVGGIYGCDLMEPLLDAGYISDLDSLKSICSKWIFSVKEFYRYGYMSPRKDCKVFDNVQKSECGFICDSTQTDSLKSRLQDKLSGYVPEDMGDDGYTAWADFVCTGDGANIFSGDHLESASPADPSFFVIHPTLERLLHAKLMAGGFDSEDWATDTKNDFVCQKAKCYISDYGDMDYYDDCCVGHFEDSKVLDFVKGNKYNTILNTNGEMISATDPRLLDYSVTYIYDKFEWDHCDDDFDALLQANYDRLSARRS